MTVDFSVNLTKNIYNKLKKIIHFLLVISLNILENENTTPENQNLFTELRG